MRFAHQKTRVKRSLSLTWILGLPGITLLCLVVIHGARAEDEQLDQDIMNLRMQIADATAEAMKYSGGVVLTEIEIRKEVLQSTLAMLQQKILASANAVTIIYRDPVPRMYVQDPNAEADLKEAISDADAAHREASLYSGGLIQTMALMREASARATIATVQQRIQLGRSGIPLPGAAAENKPAPLTPGRPTSDKDAL